MVNTSLKKALAKNRKPSSAVDQYRQMINEDYQQAPLTEAQKGEQAGINAFNSVVPEMNSIMETSRNMMSSAEMDSFRKMTSEQRAEFLKKLEEEKKKKGK